MFEGASCEVPLLHILAATGGRNWCLFFNDIIDFQESLKVAMKELGKQSNLEKHSLLAAYLYIFWFFETQSDGPVKEEVTCSIQDCNDESYPYIFVVELNIVVKIKCNTNFRAGFVLH